MKGYKCNRNRIIIGCTILLLIVLSTGCITIENPGSLNQPSSTPDNNESTTPSQSPQTGNLPVIVNFSTDRGQVSPGEEVTLSWDVAQADSITVEPEIGHVTASGSIIVQPEENTIYTLTAENSSGQSKASAAINVTRSDNAKLIALSLGDVANDGFAFQTERTPFESNTVSTYSITFVRGEELLTNTVYVYPSLAMAQDYYYSIRSRQDTTAQDIYTINQQKAFVDSDRSLAPEKPEKYMIGLTKNNVYVELGWINSFKELQSYALILESRIN